MPGFTINKVQTQDQLNGVYRITHDQYVAEGCSTPQQDGMLRHYRIYDRIPETVIFIAQKDNKLVGTLSVTISNMTGFPCDEDFRDEVAKIKETARIMGRKIANCWRLVTDRSTNLEVVFLLINAAVEECAKQHVHEILFVVNPKHVSVYQKLLGMRIVAESQVETVRAPGILLHADGRHLASKWIALCERRGIATTATVRDFWWPTAFAGKPRRWFQLW